MIRIIIQWSRIPALIVRLLSRIIIRVNRWIIIPIAPSFPSLFSLFAFLGYTTRWEAVIPRCDTWWTIAYRFLSLIYKLRPTSWWALLLCATHITVLLHTLSALGPWLSTHRISLIQNPRCSKCVAELTRQVIFLMTLLFLPWTAAAPSAALILHIEACTRFQVAITECVLWGCASAALLEEVIRVVVDKVYLWGLLLLIFYFRLSW
jgi:hypothetical protein